MTHIRLDPKDGLTCRRLLSCEFNMTPVIGLLRSAINDDEADDVNAIFTS